MKIRSIGIRGFRGYSAGVELEVKDLLALIGKNDVGKSTVLEALDIFFNEGKGCVKLDKADLNKRNLASGDDTIEICVEFDELPQTLVIDSTHNTSLAAEYLLTSRKTLKVVKRYPNAGKEKVFIQALHPTTPGGADLLLKKNPELKKMLDDQGLECVDKTKNSELRSAIWRGQDDLALQEIEIEVAKIDAKNIWDQLRAYMPLYTLFQADRKNSDADDEVQDPMALAVREILGDQSIQDDLSRIALIVKQRLEKLAMLTLAKLKELNPEVASTLTPQIPENSSLKWAEVFRNVAITGDDEIPINKRGSGVKRLVLISFFRAEAERRQQELGLPNVIYAIEEPETSQHPGHQRALLSALVELSCTPATQIILTTHSPEIVKQLRFENLLLIAGQEPREIRQVRVNELPYPSLNEVNYAAFDEATIEYHNELYGFIEAEGALDKFRKGQSTMLYSKLNKDGSAKQLQVVLSDYIRHQIHHPENSANALFTEQQLRMSIELMRTYISSEQLIDRNSGLHE